LHASIAKFGAEANDDNPAEVSLGDDIPFYIGPNWREQMAKEQNDSLDIKSVICRTCGGGHYTMRCTSSPRSTVVEIEEPKITGKYVAPRLRDAGETGYVPEESTCLRVSGVSLEITEQEFRDRFTRFGQVERVFLPRTFEGEKRGYGYISFARREDAARAMEVMDRKGYDNEIMRITWDERPPPILRSRGKT
jgi:translation initiation factor 3 subunit G